ncbi:MAG TPA: TonB-dependent receptor [Kofleriaceae bacterium]|nr:TonB-dependent receptor [Kofleriaceae bacterium]
MNRIIISLLVLLALAGTATAQSLTTGAVQGVVTDASTGEPLVAVTVVATSPALQGSQAAITDETGHYKITNLPPGTYAITCYFADVAVRRTVDISANKTTPGYLSLDTAQAIGEVITIDGKAPSIDPTATTQGVTIDSEYTRRLPVGRDYESVLSAAAGGGSDDGGATFSGSSSLENQYIVDGVNTTTLVYGQLGSPVVNEFIEQTEIITGGYNAEFGRSTGGVINVVTKTGSNEFRGSVFGYANPGALVASATPTPTQSASIDSEYEVDYDADVGFEIGGPILRDKLWFYAGLAPHSERERLSRVTKRRVDADGDGIPDVDPETGFLVFEELDRQELRSQTTSYPFVGKLNFAVAPEHQGSLSIVGNSGSADDIGLDGLASATRFENHALTTDVAARWTSKLNDNKTELEALIGWHRSSFRQDPRDASAMSTPRQNLFFGDLGVWGGLGGESQRTIDGCVDGTADDPYPMIRNCPDEGVGYAIGGAGYLADSSEGRIGARLGVTQRFAVVGHHEVKAGLDLEDNRLRTRRGTSGDVIYDVNLPTDFSTGETIAARYVRLAPDGNPDGLPDMCPDSDNGTNYACELLGPTDVHAQTVNWAAYLRDSWQIRSDLTINAGMRYEEQRVRYAKDLQNQVDPFTGELRGTDAVQLKNMWAPRLGVIYDWTGEGRSKLYGHWGRFYESVPMAMNSINFGGETTYRRVYDPAQCGDAVEGVGGADGIGCEASGEDPALGSNVYGSGVLVAPGVKPQYMDEAILGVEVALFDDLKLGVSFHDRRLGRVLEDVSPDNTETYILSNPGEFPEEEEARLLAEIEATTDPAERERLEHLLEVFTGIRNFDKPSRVHNALQFSAVKRFAASFFVQASYTYSRTRGNFPGLYSPDSGAILPNITGQYDLIELLGNRYGPLPSDRPHDLKIDGYYVADLEQAGELTGGARFRIASGTPVDALGASNMYGYDESFVLPRGAFGRSAPDTGLDLHFSYGRKFSKDVELEVFTDIFNVFNRQAPSYVDESYSYDVVNPILGGDGEDLVFAKTQDWDGNEPDDPTSPTRNRNFRNAETRTPPLAARLGARLTF